MRERLIASIEAQMALSQSALPVVELDEFFDGNTAEDSIAPNQVGYGRPDLLDLYAKLRAIRDRDDVQTVLVGIHDDWVEAKEHPEVWPAAENVYIYTSAPLETIERWIEGLAADGAIEGWPYGKHPSAPAPTEGYKVFSICWD